MPRRRIECAQTKEDTPQNTLVSTKSKDESQEPMAEIRLVSAKDREEMSLSTRQARDPELTVVMKYLQSGVLPPDDKKARELILGKTRYVIIEDMFCNICQQISHCKLCCRRKREWLCSKKYTREDFWDILGMQRSTVS